MQFKECNYDAVSSPLIYYFLDKPWVLKVRVMKDLE